MHFNVAAVRVVYTKSWISVFLLACVSCLVSAVQTYTLPTTPPISPVRARYPVGYDPDNRSRPQRQFPASSILKAKPVSTSSCTRTRGEAKTARWAPHIGYDPRRRPTLRRTDTSMDMALHNITQQPEARFDASVCPLPECTLDPRTHLCMGIWMGRSIIERRCQKIE